MKKIFKNKNIKILITSLLCGLTFTYINASAMESNEQKQSQESNNKSNSTFDFKNAMDMQSNFEQAVLAQKSSIRIYNFSLIEDLNDKIKKIEDYINSGNFFLFSYEINKTYEFLEKNKEYIDKNEVKNLNEKLKNKIIESLEDEIKKIQEYNNSENFDLALFFINNIYESLEENEKYINENIINDYKNKTKNLKEIIEKNKRKKIIKNINTTYGHAINYIDCEDLDSAIRDLNEIIKSKKSYSSYLNIKDIEKIDEIIENLNREIAIKKLNKNYENANERINNNDFISALNIIAKIIYDKEKYSLYLKEENKKEFEEKINELKKNIENRKKSISIKRQLESVYNDATNLIASGNTGSLLFQKIEVMKHRLEQNKQYLNDYEIINIENQIRELEETFESHEKNKETQMKKQS